MSTNCENCKRLEKRVLELEQRCQELELQVRELFVTCPHCQTNTTADLPVEYSPGLVGSKLAAFISTLRPEFHMSVRQIQKLLVMLFGATAKISEGTIVNVESGTSRAAASGYQEVRNQIQKSSSIWADETGWFHPGTRPWLWVATSENLSLFQLSLNRSNKALRHLLGDYSGFLTSDRWGST